MVKITQINQQQKGNTAMTDSNVISLNNPEHIDPLQELLRDGARRMLASAIEAEIEAFIAQHQGLKTEEGKAAVVRNG